MRTMPACGNCGRPVDDGAALCATCTTALTEALYGVPALLDDLMVTYIKQDRLSSGTGHRGKLPEAPLPVRFDISATIAALGSTLITWARDLVDRYVPAGIPDAPRRTAHNGRRGPVFQPTTPHLDLICYAAQWLAGHGGLLRQHPAAIKAHQAITGAIAAAEMAIDRPSPMAYRGPCVKCAASGGRVDLHAAPNAVTVKCDRCRETYDGAHLRERLLDQATDQLVTTVELSAALTALSGTSVPIGTIRSWRSRGQLVPHAWLRDDRVVVARPLDDRDKPLFRVGEAAELLRKLRAS